MIAISLQSGSSGNCIYVEADDAKLLFDAGISGARAEERLAAHGRDIRDVDALIISHDHADHVRNAGVFNRKFRLPVYITRPTLTAAGGKYALGAMNDVRYFRAGDWLQFGDVVVETVPTPHDGVDGVCFVVASGGKRLGVLTDLGHVFDDLPRLISSLDAVILESNYDPVMLANGPYPIWLQRRVSGPGGHISNGEAAELLRPAARARLRWACLAHLSENNNSPQVALRTHMQLLPRGFPIHIAGRYEATEVLEV